MANKDEAARNEAALERQEQHKEQLEQVNTPPTDERDQIAEGEVVPARTEEGIAAELRKGKKAYSKDLKEKGLTKDDVNNGENPIEAPAGIPAPENREPQPNHENEHQLLIEREAKEGDVRPDGTNLEAVKQRIENDDYPIGTPEDELDPLPTEIEHVKKQKKVKED